MAKHGAVPDDREGGAAGGGGGHRRGDSRPRAVTPAPLRSVRGKAKTEGPLALDRLIHERIRLGILSALAATDSLSFNDLKKLLETTDGNLSVHARKLEEASYIACTKSFENRVPKTEYSITPAGRRAFERYLDHMEALIRAARER
ncbi:MAG: winged helix-turn-helix domain-containing protein [Gemmatimonadaceae bacterium]